MLMMRVMLIVRCLRLRRRRGQLMVLRGREVRRWRRREAKVDWGARCEAVFWSLAVDVWVWKAKGRGSSSHAWLRWWRACLLLLLLLLRRATEQTAPTGVRVHDPQQLHASLPVQLLRVPRLRHILALRVVGQLDVPELAVGDVLDVDVLDGKGALPLALLRPHV